MLVRQTGLLRALILGVALLAGTVVLPSCDELIEAMLCRQTGEKLCNKWFGCWPIMSATLWGSEAACRTTMREFCDHSDDWVDCDINNDTLSDCNDGIEGSACGSLPSGCTDMYDCWESQ